MLLHDGEVKAVGDPGEVARKYLRLNFESAPSSGGDSLGEVADVVVEDAWLEDASGERATNVEKGQELHFCAELEAKREVEGPTFGFTFANPDGVEVMGFGVPLDDLPDRVTPGQRLRIRTKIENRLAPGRYVVRCWIHRNRNISDIVLYSPHVLDFVVFGKDEAGVAFFETEVEMKIEGGEGQ
jgi:hypothetical protein